MNFYREKIFWRLYSKDKIEVKLVLSQLTSHNTAQKEIKCIEIDLAKTEFFFKENAKDALKIKIGKKTRRIVSSGFPSCIDYQPFYETIKASIFHLLQ